MLHIAQGLTKASDWVNYSEGVGGIFVDVDTSQCGFTNTPHYIVSIEGTSNHWYLNGTSAIYNASPSGFRVYVRWTDDNVPGSPILPSPVDRVVAEDHKWRLRWTGIETGLCE